VTNGSEHEVASYQGVSYAYINDERLKTVTSGSNSYQLAYDALGRCVKRTLNGVTTYYIYDGEKPIVELFANGAAAGLNIYGKGIDEILVRVDYVVNPAGQAYYYQQDHEGSVTHLTDGSGTVIEKYKYDVFGAPTVYDGAGNLRSGGTIYNNRFLFTGREYSAMFGFYEYRARAYHPGLGRFMSEDPKGFDAGDYNLYRYCHNDPEDLTDPMGLWPVPPAEKAPIPEGFFQREMDHNPIANATQQAFQQAQQKAAVDGKFYVREGQLTLLNRSRGEAIAVRMESGTGPATNVPEAEGLKYQGPLPRGDYRILSRTVDGSQLYKHTGFKGYILAPLDSTPYNDKYDAFGRGSFRMHYGQGVAASQHASLGTLHASKIFSTALQRYCNDP
jgi:RHS repeat-associated protein